MTVRYLVEGAYQVTGRGPAVMGLLQDGVISNGDTLKVTGSDATVRIRWVEFHATATDHGLRIGLLLHPEDAPSVTAGSTLTGLQED